MKKNTKWVSTLLIVVIAAASIAAIVVSVLVDSGLVAGYHPAVARPREGQVRVACVGDSLTYGFGIPDRTRACYPAGLQNRLGDGYCVANFGFSGRTVSPEGDRPYSKEQLYLDSLAYDAHIVVIMLGSNDTKPFNWVSDEYYLAQYRNLIDRYLAGASLQRLVLMAPTPVFAKGGKVPYQINQSIIDRLGTLCQQLYQTLLPTAAAKGIALDFVDLYPLFADRPALFSDGAHPTKEGAAIIADRLAALLSA